MVINHRLPHRLDFATTTILSSPTGLSLLQHGIQKLEQCLARFVTHRSQVVIQRRVVLALGGIGFGGNAGLLQYLEQSLRLSPGFGMVSDVQDQKRRNVLTFGDVRERGQVFLH